MSQYAFPFSKPLWRRRIPKYPLYWKGDPQLRILLPQFWMKVVKPKRKVPPNMVHFEVHPQMSKLDIKQYLEKIYNVPTININTEIREGMHVYNKMIKDHGERAAGGTKALWREDDQKFAYVMLAEGHTFTYPDLLKEGSQLSKDMKELEEEQDAVEKKELEEWDKRSIPPWFR